MKIEQYEKVVIAILLGTIKELAPNKILAEGHVIYTRNDNRDGDNGHHDDDDDDDNNDEYIEYYTRPLGRSGGGRNDWFLTVQNNISTDVDDIKIYIDWAYVSITIDSNFKIEYNSTDNKIYPITCEEDIFNISLVDNIPSIDFNFLCNLKTLFGTLNKNIFIWPDDF